MEAQQIQCDNITSSMNWSPVEFTDGSASVLDENYIRLNFSMRVQFEYLPVNYIDIQEATRSIIRALLDTAPKNFNLDLKRCTVFDISHL